jgi:peptidoglycan/xylan/chitin deacetylase (PgdA/CDA1 family)
MMTTGEIPSAPAAWPEGKQAAISFTFDNLGEAAELELGLWPEGESIGRHYSAIEVVPQLLRRFPNLRGTFFIEGWNCDVYPQTIKDIAAAGHEVGLHGWRHELWRGLDPDAQRSIVSRGAAAMRSLGVVPRGFRPPGGQTSHVLHEALLKEGMTYVSDVADTIETVDGVVRLPFAWLGVDGVFLEPELGKAASVDGAEDSGLDGMMRHHRCAIEAAKRNSGHLVLVFHPFVLGKDPARIDALGTLIEEALADDAIWVAPCHAVADWLAQAASQDAVAEARI